MLTGLSRDLRAAFTLDEAVRLYRELADVGPNNRLANRQALPYSFDDELCSAPKYIGEGVGVLAGDKVAVGGKPHSFHEI